MSVLVPIATSDCKVHARVAKYLLQNVNQGVIPGGQ